MTMSRPKPIIGVYEKPFWEFVQQRKLKLQRCSCGHWRYPPGPICPKCSSTSYEWHETSGRGRLISWTTFYRQYFPEFPVPYIVVCAALEEGPILISNFRNGSAAVLKADMQLRIIYEDTRTKEGDWVIYQWSV
jgi:hypothetical protein